MLCYYVCHITYSKILLFELMSLNKCLVTARLITFMITEIFVDGFDMVPQSGNPLQDKPTLIAGLWVLLICWVLI